MMVTQGGPADESDYTCKHYTAISIILFYVFMWHNT